jgi:hypothetical protein
MSVLSELLPHAVEVRARVDQYPLLLSIAELEGAACVLCVHVHRLRALIF